MKFDLEEIFSRMILRPFFRMPVKILPLYNKVFVFPIACSSMRLLYLTGGQSDNFYSEGGREKVLTSFCFVSSCKTNKILVHPNVYRALIRMNSLS